MKIWIDFINTPQVSFWVPFIKEFKKESYDLILTCRDSGNTKALLIQQGFDFHLVGETVGKGSGQKMLLFAKRLFELLAFIRLNKPDIAVSQSSFYQPIVAKLLGIKCIYTNDNEHAKGNIFGFLFANKVILPIALNQLNAIRKSPLKFKVSFYPSIKESIYLSQQPELIQIISAPKNFIYFRPEPWSAQYYDGPLNFFDSTLLLLSSEYKVVILPRDKNQVKHYKQSKFNRLTVTENPLQLKEIISNCNLFIGAGGSMTRELAVLGIRVISIYQAELLCVDKYLVSKGKMIIKPDINYYELKSILLSGSILNNDMDVLNEGIESFKILKKMIINTLYDYD